MMKQTKSKNYKICTKSNKKLKTNQKKKKKKNKMERKVMRKMLNNNQTQEMEDKQKSIHGNKL